MAFLSSVEDEATRFISAIHALQNECQYNLDEGHEYAIKGRNVAALKRASMDLQNKLVRIRGTRKEQE